MTNAATQVPELLTRGDVAHLLGVPLKTLTWWIWAWRKHRRYTEFEISRANGETRVIHAPIKPIKDMQRTLADALTKSYQAPSHVHGFVPRRSPVSNARIHRRQHWLLRIDIEDFFPSIHFGRVRGMFMAYPFDYQPDVATLLAALCCHDNELPQGAPTSPIISNYICRRMDTELAHLAKRERCFYTRYADDLCFSTDRNVFPSYLATSDDGVSVAGSVISRVVAANGFSINDDKTRLMRSTQRQRITGLVVNERVNLPNEYVRGLRNLLYIWRRHGERDAAAAFERAVGHRNWPPGKPRAEFRLVVRGRLQYLGMIKGWEHPTYRRLAHLLSTLDETFVPVTVAGGTTVRALAFTEGESDVLHLRAAHKWLAEQGAFHDLQLDFQELDDHRGDKALLQQCKAQSRTRQRNPHVFVFDRDNPEILKDVDGPQGWRNWGNGVVSVPLVAPAWRDNDALCVELLYEDEVFDRRDDEDRRLFMRHEFDAKSGVHHTGQYTTPNPQRTTVVCEAVYEVATNKSVGLAKRAFAEAIANAAGSFAGVSFEGFRGTFDIIRQAVIEADRELSSAS